MDGEETKSVSGSSGMVDAAALAKAALAQVMSKPNGEKVAPPPTVVALQAELAALKAKLASDAPPPSKAVAAKAAKAEKKAAKQAAKAEKLAAKQAAKAAKQAAKAAKKVKAKPSLSLVESTPMTVEQAKAFVATFEGKKGRRPASFYEAQKIAGIPSGAASVKPAKSPAKEAKALAKAEKLAAKELKAAIKAEKLKAEKLAKSLAKEAKAVAKAATKAEKTAAKVKSTSDKKTPSTGQGGSVIKDLTAEDLNDKETAIMLALGTEGQRTDKTIKDLAAECFPNKTKAKANSWTRNGLRRLVRAKFLEKDGRGVFKHSVEGRAVAKKLEELKAAKK